MDINIKKAIILALILAGALLLSVGYSDSRYRTAVGRVVPPLELNDRAKTQNLMALRGDYVLLSFWSALNAPSRREINQYTAWERMNPNCGIKLIGVNMDDSKALFESVVHADSLNMDDQYWISPEKSSAVSRDFSLDGGYGSILIGPDGRILKHNPSVADLAAYTGSAS